MKGTAKNIMESYGFEPGEWVIVISPGGRKVPAMIRRFEPDALGEPCVWVTFDPGRRGDSLERMTDIRKKRRTA